MKKRKTNKPPKILYKYLDPEGLKVLTSLTLRFTNPRKVNDPFEARMPIVLQLASDLTGNPERKTISPKLQLSELEVLIGEYGISCFSEVPNDLLMWAHYARSHSGFVIGFKADHPSFRACGDLIPVTYSEHRLQLSLKHEDAVLKALSAKSKPWKHEKEWRIVTPLDSCNRSKGAFLKPIHPDCISKVILGVGVDEDLVGRVIKWQSKHPNIKLRRNRLNSLRYRLFPDENLHDEPSLIVSDEDTGGASETHLRINMDEIGFGRAEFKNGTLVFREITKKILNVAKKSDNESN